MIDPAQEVTPDTPIRALINPRAHKTIRALEQLSLTTVGQLIEYLPFRYEDRTNLRSIALLTPDEMSVIRGQITSVSTRKTKRGVLLVQARITDESGSIAAIWFNQRYLLKQLRTMSTITLYGTKKLMKPLGNPFMASAIIARPEIVPIYRRTRDISQTTFRKLFETTLRQLSELPEIVPEELRRTFNLPKRLPALRRAHQPLSVQDFEPGRRLLAFEELLLLGLKAEQARQARLQEQRPTLPLDLEFLKTTLASFPFSFTDSQRRATWEILQDLERPQPMNRLLYGEVGSGKTAVAAIVAAAAAQSGRRVAILCPTVALAHQLARVTRQLLEKTSLKIGLQTSLEKTKEEQSIVIGTHTLLQSDTIFDLVIIDEQQRFGVEQRQALVKKNRVADVLMMTATPIPRSLAQTILHQLDITYLTQKPANRQEVETIRFLPRQRRTIEQAIEKRIAAGEPGYVICPRITEENSDEVDLLSTPNTSIESEAKRLRSVFPNARIAVVHGKEGAQKNTKVLSDFRDGTIDILIATTVIEVGIDNPNATWILIEDADYFGLSTLHQLRGRVGRGSLPSICYVSDTKADTRTSERLEFFCQATDGLRLAEYDLTVRGPGDILGLSQSGAARLRYADWSDTALLESIFAAAAEIIDRDINRYPLLLKVITKRDELAAA